MEIRFKYHSKIRVFPNNNFATSLSIFQEFSQTSLDYSDCSSSRNKRHNERWNERETSKRIVIMTSLLSKSLEFCKILKTSRKKWRFRELWCNLFEIAKRLQLVNSCSDQKRLKIYLQHQIWNNCKQASKRSKKSASLKGLDGDTKPLGEAPRAEYSELGLLWPRKKPHLRSVSFSLIRLLCSGKCPWCLLL